MPNQLPGYTAGPTQTPRDIFLTKTGAIEIPGGAVLDGTNGIDGSHTGYPYDLRAGWPIAKITSSGLWVPCKRTRADGAGSAATSLVVDNAAAFKAGDSILIGSAAAVAIASIDYSTDTITLAAARTWSDDDDVRTNNGAETCRGYLGDYVRLRNDDNTAAANKPGTLIVGGVLKQSLLYGDTDAIWSDPESAKYLKLLLLSDDQSQSPEGSFDDLTVADALTVGGTLTVSGSLTFGDGINAVAGTTTGTKIGTATGQKLGFFNATPVIQPSGATQGALTDSTGGAVDGTLADVTGSFNQGILNNNFADVASRINALRTALLNLGLIKGSA